MYQFPYRKQFKSLQEMTICDGLEAVLGSTRVLGEADSGDISSVFSWPLLCHLSAHDLWGCAFL